MFVNVMTKQQAKKAKKAAERYEVRAYAGSREDWRDWKMMKTIWTDWKIRKIVVWRTSRVRIRERSEKKSEEQSCLTPEQCDGTQGYGDASDGETEARSGPVGDALGISLQPNGCGEGSGRVGDVISGLQPADSEFQPPREFEERRQDAHDERFLAALSFEKQPCNQTLRKELKFGI